MTTPTINVIIKKNNECLFEESSRNVNESTAELTNNLKEIQQIVNDFLTTLVDADRKELNQGGKEPESDEQGDESDDSEDDLEAANPKKCRLGN